MLPFAAVLGLSIPIVLPLLIQDMLHIWQDNFLAEAKYLSRHGKIYHLLLESACIDLEFLVPAGHIGREPRSSEDVEVWNNLFAEGNIDIGGQYRGEEGSDKIHDEILLSQGKIVLILRSVVLVLSQAGCDACEKRGDGGQG